MFIQILKQKARNISGFTLVETMMYVAFIATTIVLFVGFGSKLSDYRAKTSVIMDVESNGTTAINLLEDYLKKSNQILMPILGGPATSTLLLDMSGLEANKTFFIVDGVLYISDSISDPVQITSDAVNIKKLSFVNTASLGQKDNIIINLDMEYRYHGSKAYEYNKQYESTVTLR